MLKQTSQNQVSISSTPLTPPTPRAKPEILLTSYTYIVFYRS